MKNLKEVDWSKAPEGATHYNNVRCFHPWLKETPASFFDGRSEVWVEYTNISLAEEHFNEAVKRPQEPQEWDGSGVPPVGTVCEFTNHPRYKTSWVKVKVVFIGENLIVFVHGASGNEFSERIDEVSFRLIKTPEQIAEEERQQAIDEMMSLIKSHTVWSEVFGEIYDAGYRKTEKK